MYIDYITYSEQCIDCITYSSQCIDCITYSMQCTDYILTAGNVYRLRNLQTTDHVTR